MNRIDNLPVTVTMVREEPDLRLLGVTMLPRIEKFALELEADPEKMKAFQEWKAQWERKRAAAS